METSPGSDNFCSTFFSSSPISHGGYAGAFLQRKEIYIYFLFKVTPATGKERGDLEIITWFYKNRKNRLIVSLLLVP
jgi:hypothetical protein